MPNRTSLESFGLSIHRRRNIRRDDFIFFRGKVRTFIKSVHRLSGVYIMDKLLLILNLNPKKDLTVIMVKKDTSTSQNGQLTNEFIWSKIISILFSFDTPLNDFYPHIETRLYSDRFQAVALTINSGTIRISPQSSLSWSFTQSRRTSCRTFDRFGQRRFSCISEISCPSS